MINRLLLHGVDSLRASYALAYPFPHIVLDNFIDHNTCEKIVKEIKLNTRWGTDTTVPQYQVNKFYLPDVNENDLSAYTFDIPVTKYVLEYLNSNEVLKFLEKLTGIESLIPDTSFFGGGVHKVNTGGKLAVHADFNIHLKNQLHRRINLLLYLNPVWKEEWEGNLELWDRNLKTKCISVPPIFNRVVIFNTTDNSYHGHPIPLACPQDVSRFSIAMYYYTKDRPENEKAPWHAVLWKDT